MSKLSALKKAIGSGGKEEEKQGEPVSQSQSAANEKTTDPKETTPPQKDQDSGNQDSKESTVPQKTEESKMEEPKKEEKPESKEPKKEATHKKGSKNDEAEKSTPATPPQSDSKDDTEEKEGEEPDEKKPGRKKGIRRDRVIVMLDKETIEVLDSFPISRSGVARAVILACQEFLVNIEGDIKEDELIAMVEGKLG